MISLNQGNCQKQPNTRMDWKVEEKNINAFFALVRAGLWADVESTGFLDQVFAEPVDWDKVYQLSGEQSVQGLVLQGVDCLMFQDSLTSESAKPSARLNIPQELLLQWIGEMQMQEQQNKAMNDFIGKIVGKMRTAGIYTLLVKGQGVAQCYEKPQWRVSGDVDFYLSNDNYEQTKEFLMPLAQSVEPEGEYQKHLNMTIDSWVVELHGSMRCGLSKRMDKVIDGIHHEIFYEGYVRSWQNGHTQVFLPSAGNDVIIVFTHFLKHFFKGGIGLRQICDWCRLLWTYRDSIHYKQLEKRLSSAGLMTEWKAFGTFAVEYLGMPREAMPFYSADGRWKNKAKKIMQLTLDSADIERRDKSYFENNPYAIRKAISFGFRCSDLLRVAGVFPMDSLRFFPCIVIRGLKSAVKGE